MLKKQSISLIIAAVLIMPLTVFAIVHWAEQRWRSLPVFTGEGYTIADFSLLNQHGQTVSRDDWKGNIIVASFFFTHCPVICPKMVSNLKKVRQAYPADAQLQFHSFSVDPARDSVAQLQRFAERFHISGNWHLLTGEKKRIYALARGSFSVTATEGDGGDHDFIHSEKLVLIDRELRIRGYYKGTADKDIQQLIQDIKKLKDEN